MSNYEVCQEMGQNFIDYAYAVNTDRSIPSAADGLKPVHRRILWSMYKEKNTSDKAHVKSARIVGDVIGKYHPHGDTSVYDAMTRLAQEWNVRYPLIDWHGNKGNIGGDGAAAMRYTEARLDKLAEEGLLANINKEIVQMQPNYSEDLEEPVVLPALFPNLLCNPNSGIGVAMACNWLPYNLREIINQVLIPYLSDEEVDYSSIYPDFPTGGCIINKNNVKTVNETGRGSIIVDGRWKEEKRDGKTLIVFYEIPYGTKIEYEDQGKPKGIIAQLRKAIEDEKLLGVADVRDESSKTIRVVIELESGANVETVVAQAYSTTDLRKSFSANYVALVNKTPKLLSLGDAVKIYSRHNLDCILHEFSYEYKKTVKRLHILEGLIWAVEHIDEVIKCVREDISLTTLTDSLDEVQEKAILDMKLGRLSRLETDKLVQEKEEKEKYRAYCDNLINYTNERKKLLIERLRELDKKFGDARRTVLEDKEIIKATAGKKAKVIIPEDVFVAFSSTGYLKSIPARSYRTSSSHKSVIKCQTTDMILLFSSLGKVYRLKADAIKQCGLKDKGTAVGALLNLEKDEIICNIFSMDTNEARPYVVGFTRYGLVKKSEKSLYVGTTQNKNGLKAAGLNDGDEYIGWYECNGDYAVLLSSDSYVIKFDLHDINPVGKTAKGVKGISLNDGKYVLDARVVSPQVDLINILRYNNLRNKDLVLQRRGGKGKCLADK